MQYKQTLEPHLPLQEEDRAVIIRFGHDWDQQCMQMDEVGAALAGRCSCSCRFCAAAFPTHNLVLLSLLCCRELLESTRRLPQQAFRAAIEALLPFNACCTHGLSLPCRYWLASQTQ